MFFASNVICKATSHQKLLVLENIQTNQYFLYPTKKLVLKFILLMPANQVYSVSAS